jgi:hypothetical protein
MLQIQSKTASHPRVGSLFYNLPCGVIAQDTAEYFRGKKELFYHFDEYSEQRDCCTHQPMVPSQFLTTITNY